MFDLVPCHELPFLMIAVAILGATYLIFTWATFEPRQLPPWKWGDKQRRAPKASQDLIAHLIGGFFAAFATAYALNHPLCG